MTILDIFIIILSVAFVAGVIGYSVYKRISDKSSGCGYGCSGGCQGCAHAAPLKRAKQKK